MKFTILKTNLLNALNTVSKAISNKNPNAILTGVRLDLNELGLTLIGTDTDISISTFISKNENDEQIITVFETGSIIISCKYILDIVRKFDSEVIEFELVEHSLLKVRDNLSDFSLNTMKVEDFPNIDFEDAGNPVVIKSESLREIIDQTCFAASDKETRPILTGVNFKANGKVLECVATDSYRLAKKTITLGNPSEEEINIVIPGKNIIELDEESSMLGEVALVPFDSPVNQTGLLFYNTLYDENAACHLALGVGFPSCYKNGVNMTKEELLKVGVNQSNEHVDFMIGTSDLRIVGTTVDNEEILIFENGNFAWK